MANSNVIVITANLPRDPEMQYVGSGTALTKFSLPVDVGYGDNKDTEWVRIAVFGKQAEACHEHLRKGSLVQVVGVLEKTWVSDKGQANIQVKATQVNFLANFGKQEEQAEFVEDDIPF